MGFFASVTSELAYLKGALRALGRIKGIAKAPEHTICDTLEEVAGKFGRKTALYDETSSLSYEGLFARSNQYARWAMAQGIRKGDAVALMMGNSPEYVAIWMGVIRAGGICALINTNLASQSLAHCIRIARAAHVIVTPELLDQYKTAEEHLEEQPEVWIAKGYEGAVGTYQDLETVVNALDGSPIPASERPRLTIDDTALYIYTSGTTGLPKAANITHYRVQSIMNGFSAAMQAESSDKIYICLPMYHTNGGVIAVGAVLTVGGTAYIRDKFSRSQFWVDVVREKCTLFQYIGELCRYLLFNPPSDLERRHALRTICGNGLRPDIWREFRERFQIPRIVEFYGATEGNCVMFNFDNKEGSVGRIPSWAKKRFTTEVIRFDIEQEQPVRGPDGRCIIADANEIGEVISEAVIDPNRPSNRFDGYADPAATEKKLLRNVFRDGDVWFRTGDLMRRDEKGYFYFIDRIGDTFRWKGENIATSEVAETIAAASPVREVSVYGVQVPGHDGRAGMAAVVADEGFDLQALVRALQEQLPGYARPLFYRMMESLETTSTFKIKKFELVKAGFNPLELSEPLYFADPATGEAQTKANILVDAVPTADGPAAPVIVCFAERDGVPNGTGDALSALYIAIAGLGDHRERWTSEELAGRFPADRDPNEAFDTVRHADLRLLTALADELVARSLGRAELAIPDALPGWTALGSRYRAAHR